jgi:hypothetical protein
VLNAIENVGSAQFVEVPTPETTRLPTAHNSQSLALSMDSDEDILQHMQPNALKTKLHVQSYRNLNREQATWESWAIKWQNMIP